MGEDVMAFVFEDEVQDRFVFEPEFEQTKKEGIVEGFIKPTVKAIPRVLGSAVGGLGAMPLSGLYGLYEGIKAGVQGQDALSAAGQGIDFINQKTNVTTTPEEAQGLENVMLPMKVFEYAGKGGQAVGRATGIPYAEPVLGTLAEAGAMFALPKVASKIKLPERTAKPSKAIEGDKITQELFKDRYIIEDEPIKVAEEVKESAPKEDLSALNILEEAKTEPVIKASEVKLKETLKEAPKAETLHSNPVTEILNQYTKYVGQPVWDYVVNKTVPKLLEKSKIGQGVLRIFDTDYRSNLPQKENFNSMVRGQRDTAAIGRDYAIDLGNRLQSFSEAEQLQLGEFIRGEKSDLPANLQKIGTETKDVLYNLGKQAVDTGLLSEEAFFKNAGKYMPRLYTEFEYQGLLSKYNITKPDRLDLSRFKNRKDIPKEIREQMGEILTPGYPVAKGITQLTHDISLARLFNDISKNPQWVGEGEGFVQLSKSNKLGNLSGKYVHPEIAREIEFIQQQKPQWEKAINKAYGAWKYGKVILSPKTHIRNMMSNSVLAHLGGMPLWEQPVYLTRAIKEMATNGKVFSDVKRNSSIFNTTWTQQELRNVYDDMMSLKGVSATNPVESSTILRTALSKTKQAGNKMADLYQKEEQVYKMAKILHSLENGKDLKAAIADANKWLFDYSDVTRAQQQYRNSMLGAPFATFTLKALPRVAEAAVTTPWRFAAPFAMIYGLEESARNYFGDTKEESDKKRKLLPEYMRGKMLGMPSYPRVPVSDEFGREYYLDLTYILPWGDIGESGDFMGIPGAVRPLSHPLTNEALQQFANFDTFWERPIVRESDLAGKNKFERLITSAKIRGAHAAKTFLPTPFMDAEKAYSSAQGNPDYRGRLRPSSVVASDVLFGVKMQPVDYAEQAEKLIRKLDPNQGRIAAELKAGIRTASLRKAILESKGKDTSKYDKEIQGYIEQLEGMGQELQKAVGE